MANKEKGEVAFKVGEKRFTIKLGSNEVAEATPHLGGRVIFEADLRDMMVFRALLFVMCKGQNGVDAIEDAGNLIDEDPIGCANAVQEALSLFFQRWIQIEKQKAASL